MYIYKSFAILILLSVGSVVEGARHPRRRLAKGGDLEDALMSKKPKGLSPGKEKETVSLAPKASKVCCLCLV